MAEESTDLAVKEEGGAVAVYDYGMDAGAGSEGAVTASAAVPFLNILQALSPQVQDDEPKGSKAGDLFNSVTHERYEGDAGVVFLPCFVDELYVEWTPRADGGGGPHGRYKPTDKIVTDAIKASGTRFGPQPIENGNDLIQTFYVYGLILDADGSEVVGPAVFSFKSMAIKSFDAWRTTVDYLKGKPPLFAIRTRIRTKKEKNDKGTFFVPVLEPGAGERWSDALLPPDSDVLALGRELYTKVKSGALAAAYDTESQGGGGKAEDDEKAVPF